MSQPTRIFVVINPRSRVAAPKAVAALARAKPEAAQITVFETEKDRLVSEILGDRIEEADTVVAVGGDGIVSQCAAAIGRRGIPLGIIPGGSTNMVAKVSGIPSNPEAAAKLIFGEHLIDYIDMGVSGDYCLVHAGGAGLDARIFQKSSSKLKKKAGWLAYVPAMAMSVSLKQSAVRLTIEDTGEVIDTRSQFIFLANSASLVFSDFKLMNGATRRDGLIEIMIFTASDPLQITETLADLMLNRVTESRQVVHRSAASFRLEAEPPLPVEIDGEVTGETPLRMHVWPRTLALITPLEKRTGIQGVIPVGIISR